MPSWVHYASAESSNFGKTLVITGFSLTVAFSRNYHLHSIAPELAFHLNLVEKDMPTGAVVPI